ncbi:MAG: hypothetical protein HGA90_03215, partial [Alphaproteobacteria bacterium]|nr:hypothetical protein [Alphaproteobacteria bacterium]
MAETNSLTDQTLARLRKLADGNGLPAESIQLIETQESLYSVEGSIRLSPHFDTQSRTYTGPARTKGKNLQMLSNFAALQEEANQFKLKFDSPKIWAEEAIKELQNESGHGWGQHNALIAMPDQNITLAATEKCFTCEGRGLTPCPQCQSRSTILCPYCFGKGQENCYNCFGRMHEPNNPQIVCHICRGTRFAPCRNCQSRGTIPCPHCQGRGGVICEPCRGTGKMTQEIALTSSIEIDFQLGRGTELPSGLLRGMERLGLVNMSKGHAEIT